MEPAMSDADHRSGADQDTKYYLIFLHSIPERPLTAEVVDQHAAHLAELDDRGKLVMAGPIVERQGGLIVLRAESAAEPWRSPKKTLWCAAPTRPTNSAPGS
jgi:uncharacterized protein YciI